MTVAMKPRVTSLAPQFLVDDLERRTLGGLTRGCPEGGGIGCCAAAGEPQSFGTQLLCSRCH